MRTVAIHLLLLPIGLSIITFELLSKSAQNAFQNLTHRRG
jgi:hypothetical protein